MSWTLHLLQTLWGSHGFLRKAVGAELGLAEEVVVAGLVPALLRPYNGEDVCVGSRIQSLSSIGCSHWFGVHDPSGTHSIWYCLYLRGLTLFEMATSGIFHVALRVGLVTLRLSGGCIVEVNTVAAAQAEVVPGGLSRSLVFLGTAVCFLCSSLGICPCLPAS